MTDEADVFQAPRVPSGVPGLDAILGGGFVSGGTYILRGAPGAGKTIFANQACFRHAARGGRALYVTLLAESPTRMLRRMAGLDFFDPAAVPSRVYYVSALDTLSQDGPPALLGLLRAELARTGATLLVLDGLFPAAGGAGGGGFDRPIRRFLGELQDHTVKAGCVALVLDDGGLLDQGADAVVDGLIALEDTRRGAEARRHLEVAKFRGSAFLRGRHAFRITDGGIVVYPRIDALLEQRAALDEGSGGRLSAGVPELDAMLGGGLPSGTSTLLLGAAGAGKTTLGVHFLGRSSREEPGLHLGFYETPGRLSQNAASMGVGLGALAGRGDLELLWSCSGSRPRARSSTASAGACWRRSGGAACGGSSWTGWAATWRPPTARNAPAASSRRSSTSCARRASPRSTRRRRRTSSGRRSSCRSPASPSWWTTWCCCASPSTARGSTACSRSSRCAAASSTRRCASSASPARASRSPTPSPRRSRS